MLPQDHERRMVPSLSVVKSADRKSSQRFIFMKPPTKGNNEEQAMENRNRIKENLKCTNSNDYDSSSDLFSH